MPIEGSRSSHINHVLSSNSSNLRLGHRRVLQRGNGRKPIFSHCHLIPMNWGCVSANERLVHNQAPLIIISLQGRWHVTEYQCHCYPVFNSHFCIRIPMPTLLLHTIFPVTLLVRLSLLSTSVAVSPTYPTASPPLLFPISLWRVEVLQKSPFLPPLQSPDLSPFPCTFSLPSVSLLPFPMDLPANPHVNFPNSPPPTP